MNVSCILIDEEGAPDTVSDHNMLTVECMLNGEN